MSGNHVAITLVALVAAAATLATAGCGTSQQEKEQARRQAAEHRRLKEKAAQLEVEIKQLKEQQAQLVQSQPAQPGTTQTQTQTQTTPASRGPSSDCGGGVSAGTGTSCAFALNTAKEWVDTSGGTTIQVYSPTTRKSYTMNCSTGPAGTTCKGGRGAIVYIR